MNVYDLSRAINELIPPSLREEWDNDGLMVAPDMKREIKKAVIALDATTRAIDFAVHIGADAIITHHPLIFRGLSALTVDDAVGKRVINCVKNGIAVLSYHTRLDTVEGGVNDQLAKAIGLKNISAFVPFGRTGETEYEMTFEEFALQCEKALGERPAAAVSCGKSIKKAAVISGSGKGFVRDAYESGADVFVTGEASHDSLIEAAEYGINMLCLTHHATERVVLPELGNIVKRASGGSVTPVIFEFDRVNEYGV